MKVTNENTKETIDITPNWATALVILGVVCQDGTDKGKAEALKELQRLGRELDNAKLKR